MSENTQVGNPLTCKLMDNYGNPVPDDYLSSDERLKFDRAFDRLLENGDIGAEIKLYVHKDGRRKAFYTEKFYIHLGEAWESNTGDHLFAEPLEPLFTIYSSEPKQ